MEKAQNLGELYQTSTDPLDDGATKLLLGRWIQERRREVGVSAFELSQAAFHIYGVSLDGIRHIERGSRKPTAPQARSVIGILGLLEEHETFLREHMALDLDEGSNWISTPRTRIVPSKSAARMLETFSLQLALQLRVSPREDALIRLGARSLGVPLGTLAHVVMRHSLWEDSPLAEIRADPLTSLQDLCLTIRMSLTPRDLKRQRELGAVPVGPWLRQALTTALTAGTAKSLLEELALSSL